MRRGWAKSVGSDRGDPIIRDLHWLIRFAAGVRWSTPDEFQASLEAIRRLENVKACVQDAVAVAKFGGGG
jgi:hypothetical protein